MCLLIKVFDGLLQLGKTVLLFLVDQHFVNHINVFSNKCRLQYSESSTVRITAVVGNGSRTVRTYAASPLECPGEQALVGELQGDRRKLNQNSRSHDFSLLIALDLLLLTMCDPHVLNTHANVHYSRSTWASSLRERCSSITVVAAAPCTFLSCHRRTGRDGCEPLRQGRKAVVVHKATGPQPVTLLLLDATWAASGKRHKHPAQCRQRYGPSQSSQHLAVSPPPNHWGLPLTGRVPCHGTWKRRCFSSRGNEAAPAHVAGEAMSPSMTPFTTATSPSDISTGSSRGHDAHRLQVSSLCEHISNTRDCLSQPPCLPNGTETNQLPLGLSQQPSTTASTSHPTTTSSAMASDQATMGSADQGTQTQGQQSPLTQPTNNHTPNNDHSRPSNNVLYASDDDISPVWPGHGQEPRTCIRLVA